MPTAANAKILYESSQSTVTYTQATDSGDHTIFTTAGNEWSKVSGFEPSVRPNGIVTGFNLITPTGSNDEVQCAAFTAYFNGVLVEVPADSSITITRDATNDYQKFSVICDSAGALTVIESDAHATAWSDTRGAAGGPPSIPLAQIEVGQIWISDKTAAPIVANEIKQSAEAEQQERYDTPIFDYNTLGEGNQATDADKEYAHIEFAAALPTIHGATANAASTDEKPVYIQYSTPVYVTIKESVDFVPAEISTSTNSTQLYRTTIASTSDSLGACTFTAYAEDGITDNLSKLRGENIIVKFYPDENKASYMLTQGILQAVTSYPVDANISMECTVAAQQASVRFDA